MNSRTVEVRSLSESLKGSLSRAGAANFHFGHLFWAVFLLFNLFLHFMHSTSDDMAIGILHFDISIVRGSKRTYRNLTNHLTWEFRSNKDKTLGKY